MIKDYFKESINLENNIANNASLLKQLDLIILEIINCLNSGNKLLIAGNGGSAADSQHFASELVGHFKIKRRGYPAIALNSNNSIITACGNDYGFSSIFLRQVEAFSCRGDIFVAISTSGNSLNIIKAVKKAKSLGLKTICFLGDAGKLKGLADFELVVPSKNTPRIQEIHILLIHVICEEVEKRLI